MARQLFHLRTYTAPFRTAIDLDKVRGIRKACAWAEIHSKAQLWSSPDDIPKMRPLIASQGALDIARLQRLIVFRGCPKELELVFIA